MTFGRLFTSTIHHRYRFTKLSYSCLTSRTIPTTAITLGAMVLVVTSTPQDQAQKGGGERPAHHANDKQTLFKNPWESFTGMETTGGGGIFGFAKTIYHLRRDWDSKPMPPKEELIKVRKPTWGRDFGEGQSGLEEWEKDVKATWLGHACFLVEFPKKDGVRGLRVLFDPVWSHRCSPSQILGPARFTPPPMPMAEIPEVDLVVLSHNHYDHTDVATLKHIYSAQPKGTVHFFAPLGNRKWFSSIGIDDKYVTELDWWQSREVKGDSAKEEAEKLRVTCTPCQHFTGRSMTDRFHTLWSSWVIEHIPSTTAITSPPEASKVYFAGDTGYRSVPQGFTGDEDDLPHCPAFKEIGERFGGFDLAMIPIGAYSPRAFMSRVHCSPEDSVLVHKDIKSKRSIGMHWGTWVLTDEHVMEPPKRLRTACEKVGIKEGEFDACDIGETVPIKAEK